MARYLVGVHCADGYMGSSVCSASSCPGTLQQKQALLPEATKRQSPVLFGYGEERSGTSVWGASSWSCVG